MIEPFRSFANLIECYSEARYGFSSAPRGLSRPVSNIMVVNRLSKLILWVATLGLILSATSFVAGAQTQTSPSDVVRTFYKAMREHRFKDAWSMTIYKPAVDELTTEEMEDLRPDFELKAAAIPEQVEITGEQIEGNVASVFVKVPVSDSTPQITSEPVTLIRSGNSWIIGDEANQAVVKKAGRRFFLDALIDEHQTNIEEFLKRLVAVQALYGQQHAGAFGDLQQLIAESLLAPETSDPKAVGYNVRVVVSPDKKSYVVTAEPARYGHTGKLSFWMDQTGAIKSADNGGKPIK